MSAPRWMAPRVLALRALHLALAPEAVWLWLALACALAAQTNDPPTEAGSDRLSALGTWALPVTGTMLAFVLCFAVRPRLWQALEHARAAARPESPAAPPRSAPSPTRTWLRLAAATVVGLNAALSALLEGIDYLDSRNAGVFGVWVIGALAGLLSFAVCTAALKVLERRALRQPPR